MSAPGGSPAIAMFSAMLPLLLAACGGSGGVAGNWTAVVDTVGDTVVVRTVSGSVWGEPARLVPEVEIGVLDGPAAYMLGSVEALAVDGKGRIWVVDGHVPEVRVFGPDGVHVATVGRPGEGPGELKGPDGGLVVLSDGRVLVRDPRNARIQPYAPDGTPLPPWGIRGSYSNTEPLWRDRRDRVWTEVVLDPEADPSAWRYALVALDPHGVPCDTAPVPEAGAGGPFLDARVENGVYRTKVPFSASPSWAFHPGGWFVVGDGDPYRFTMLRSVDEHGGPPLRVEHARPPVPIAPEEAREARLRVVRSLRRVAPGWSWNGPDIPPHKPAFRKLYVGVDGRIWVRVSVPGHRVEDAAYDPADPASVPDGWREGVAFDVFDSEGRYLGHVTTPDGFSPFPWPVFDGEHVWAVTLDDLDVQRVVRFRLVRPARDQLQPIGPSPHRK